jgi:hypothetical protein
LYFKLVHGPWFIYFRRFIHSDDLLSPCLCQLDCHRVLSLLITADLASPGGHMCWRPVWLASVHNPLLVSQKPRATKPGRIIPRIQGVKNAGSEVPQGYPIYKLYIYILYMYIFIYLFCFIYKVLQLIWGLWKWILGSFQIFYIRWY